MRAIFLCICLFGLLACKPTPPTLSNPEPNQVNPNFVPAGKLLYQNGQLNTTNNNRYTCYASPEEEQSCQKMRAEPGCAVVSPVAYWEPPMRCSGIEIREDPI